MKNWPLILMLLAWLCTTNALAASSLDMPTLALRQQAQKAYDIGNKREAEQSLLDAQELARHQNAYVKANELRYVAEAWSRMGWPDYAKHAFSESMDAAIVIPTWNHKLYACIGVLELQRASNDPQGTYANGIKALDSGLIETIAATGEAAEMGRFFRALDGLLSAEEHALLTERIMAIDNTLFQQKALHALQSIAVHPASRCALAGCEVK
jgi:hypothetical protein